MRWRVKEDKDRKIERQKTERRKIRDAESSEGCGERQEAQRTAKKRREKKRSDSKNSEKGHGISKKLRRSRRKVEKLEITLLSLNAGQKAKQGSWAYTQDMGAGRKSKVTTYNDRQQEGSGACGASQDHLGNSR